MHYLIRFPVVTILIFAISKNVGAYPSVNNMLDFDVASRIVGGSVARENQFPYMAAVVLKTHENKYKLCGGSLISPTSILTAAHCVEDKVSANITLGARNITSFMDHSLEPKKQTFVSTTFFIHPNYVYDSTKLRNDLAIIKLPHPAELGNDNKHVKIIPIPQNDIENYAGKSATTMGWGYTSDAEGPRSTSYGHLRYITNPILTNVGCKRFYPYDHVLTDDHMCISGKGGKNFCVGDSGSPIVVAGVQVGVASFNKADHCQDGSPSAAARLSKYLEWIHAHMN